MSKLRVLLADDHEVVRTGFRRLLEVEADIEVHEAADGHDAYQRYVEDKPDVVVMDLSMPRMSGFEAARRILARDPKARILVFSVHESDTYLSRAKELGILGYISKRSAADTMLEAIRTVASGKHYLGEELSGAREGPEEQVTEPLKLLSSREFEVFCRVAEGHSVQEVAWLLNISPKTAGNHYTQLKKKLAASTAAELTLLAVRAGIISV